MSREKAVITDRKTGTATKNGRLRYLPIKCEYTLSHPIEAQNATGYNRFGKTEAIGVAGKREATEHGQPVSISGQKDTEHDRGRNRVRRAGIVFGDPAFKGKDEQEHALTIGVGEE